MFTGIVQGIATVQAVADRPGLRSFTLRFPADFCSGLAVGASVAVDGVCLTFRSWLAANGKRTVGLLA